jgi:hypothetical protein
MPPSGTKCLPLHHPFAAAATDDERAQRRKKE